MEMDQPANYGQEKRIELILDMYMKKLSANLDALREKIEIIEKKLDVQERAVRQNIIQNRPEPRMEQVQEQMQEQRQEQRQEPQRQQATTQRPQPQQAESNQRVGNFQSGDVSIEKFFYAGNKR